MNHAGTQRIRIMGRAGEIFAIALCVIGAGAALAQTATQVFRGDVVGIDRGTLRVKSNAAERIGAGTKGSVPPI